MTLCMTLCMSACNKYIDLVLTSPSPRPGLIYWVATSGLHYTTELWRLCMGCTMELWELLSAVVHSLERIIPG